MLLLAFFACQPGISPSKDTDTADTAQGAALALTTLVPESGPAAGGTTVRLSGAGFTTASTVAVDGTPCASLTFLSDEELACVTPGGAPGTVQVVVTEGAASASLPFAYVADGDTGADTGADTGDTGADTGDTGPDTGADTGDSAADTGADSGDTGGGDTSVALDPVDYCHLQYPCTMAASSGATSDVVYGWIYEAGTTEGAGRGTGIQVEVGVGPDGSDPATDPGWAWSAASYNVDKDGLFPGDLANDEYMGTFAAPGAGAWDYCVRASADAGASWTYCDAGGDTCGGVGSTDGYAPADAGQLTVR